MAQHFHTPNIHIRSRFWLATRDPHITVPHRVPNQSAITMGAGASVLRRNMGPHVSREWLVRIPFIRGTQTFIVTRIPPIGFESFEPPESSSEEDYDYDYNYYFDTSDTEHWLAGEGRDVDMA